MNYDDYRIHLEKLQYKKRQLLSVVNQKRQIHSQYREAFKKFGELKKEEDKLRQELIDLIE